MSKLSAKQQAVIRNCPLPNPKFVDGIDGRFARSKLMATVWNFRPDGQRSGIPITEAWRVSHTPENLQWVRQGKDYFNPVEIHIRPEDVSKVVAWFDRNYGEGQGQMLRVTYRYKHGYDTYNSVHDLDVPEDLRAEFLALLKGE